MTAASAASLPRGAFGARRLQNFWPAARSRQTLHEYVREFGDIWKSVPKVLASRSRTAAGGTAGRVVAVTHPVILGQGRPLFDEGAGQIECDLLEQQSFPDGVTLHRYAIRRATA